MYQTANLYLTAELGVAEVVLGNPRLMMMLEHFNIYVPFQEKSIRQVCIENKLSINLFLVFANLYNGTGFNNSDPVSFDEIRPIIRFLKNSHAYYTEEIMPDIRQIINDMYEPSNHEDISLIEKFFNEYSKEVIEHLDYEDYIAFPYMTDLYDHIINEKQYDSPVTYSVNDYKEHHNDIEEKLTDLKNLLIKYLPQKEDQKKRRKLYFNLNELEFDLNIHAIIEDMILVPLVEKMENYLKGKRE